jgi:tetratricopeptide (TPR) repeat protein
MTIQLGVLPFIQDWFSGDTNITAKAAIFGVPDFWYMAERMPVPEKMFFGGGSGVRNADGQKLAAEFRDFWKRISSVLWTERNRAGSRHIAECDDPVDTLRLQLRRHVGFIGNNLGVFLQDAKLDDEAFGIYELVLKEIDPDNVCTLFNEFEMARAGVKCAVAHKTEIERKLKAIVDDPKRRYVLWSLSRYYGYIRNPEIFARMGYAWARSGQTGNAIAQVQRAIDFVSADRQTGLLNMMAAIYASGRQTKKSREVYSQVLAKDSANREALMGMARLALQEGSMDEARGFLEKASKSAGKDAGVETALLLMMNNDLDRARMEMQRVTDTNPKSLQAWSLLAGIILQQADAAKEGKARDKIMEELENVILPKMEAVAESQRDYFVQMTRALVFMRKGPTFRKQARDALVIASLARPDVTVAGDMILNLDIAMDDGESAERHARTILRRDRADKLANYVMGSLRLKEGDYTTAETFLRASVAAEKPIAAAQNDLAEVLRRLQRYGEAEKFARDAVKNQPKLYVAWETLGSALLDQNKNLDEAEKCVEKAIELSKTESSIEDIRMQITLARVQIARGALDKARVTLRRLRKRQSELSSYDRSRLDDLMKSTTRN